MSALGSRAVPGQMDIFDVLDVIGHPCLVCGGFAEDHPGGVSGGLADGHRYTFRYTTR